MHSTGGARYGISAVHRQQAMDQGMQVATSVLRRHGAQSTCGAASALFLANGALYRTQRVRELGLASIRATLSEIVEAVGVALLLITEIPQPSTPVAHSAESLISAVGTLIPPSCIYHDIEAACWLLAALFRALEVVSPSTGTTTVVHPAASVIAGPLAAMYPTMRAMTLNLLQEYPKPGEGSCARLCLESLYGVFRAVDALQPGEKHSCSSDIAAAATALAAGGMIEGILRSGTLTPERMSPYSPLIIALDDLVQRFAGEISRSFLGIASGVAIAHAFAARCTVPRPTPNTVLCLVNSLSETMLELDPVRGMRVDHAAVLQYASMATAAAIGHMSMVGHSVSHVRETALERLQESARSVHKAYRQFYPSKNAREIAPNDLARLHATLAKLFTFIFEVLGAFQSTSRSCLGSAAITANPAALLAIAADLQFCRNSTPAYASVLKSALESLPYYPADALDLATKCLPHYSDFLNHTEADEGMPTWLVDNVLASKVQLLFTALSSCAHALSIDVCLDVLAPGAFLYVRHPHAATATAAHRLLWSLFSTLPPEKAQQIAPYYVVRCLEGGLGGSDAGSTPQLQLLSQGLATIVQVLPWTSAVPFLCLDRILRRCEESFNEEALNNDMAKVLFEIVARQLVTVHYAVVPRLTDTLGEFLKRVPGQLRPYYYEILGAVVTGTEDCVRRPGLASWFQRLPR